MNLSPPLLNLLNNTILLSIRSSIVMKQDLIFRLLPDKTLASSFEKSADGRKKVKRELQSGNCKPDGNRIGNGNRKWKDRHSHLACVRLGGLEPELRGSSKFHWALFIYKLAHATAIIDL